MKKTLLAAASLTLLMAGSAFAQSATTTNPVPGTSAGEESKMPAGAASTVTTNRDAPSADTKESTSSVPVPGNTSGIDSTATVRPPITTGDAGTVPSDTTNPVPGTSAGENSTVPAR
jgi:opacity protein-like surface antigen